MRYKSRSLCVNAPRSRSGDRSPYEGCEPLCGRFHTQSGFLWILRQAVLMTENSTSRPPTTPGFDIRRRIRPERIDNPGYQRLRRRVPQGDPNGCKLKEGRSGRSRTALHGFSRGYFRRAGAEDDEACGRRCRNSWQTMPVAIATLSDSEPQRSAG